MHVDHKAASSIFINIVKSPSILNRVLPKHKSWIGIYKAMPCQSCTVLWMMCCLNLFSNSWVFSLPHVYIDQFSVPWNVSSPTMLLVILNHAVWQTKSRWSSASFMFLTMNLSFTMFMSSGLAKMTNLGKIIHIRCCLILWKTALTKVNTLGQKPTFV